MIGYIFNIFVSVIIIGLTVAYALWAMSHANAPPPQAMVMPPTHDRHERLNDPRTVKKEPPPQAWDKLVAFLKRIIAVVVGRR